MNQTNQTGFVNPGLIPHADSCRLMQENGCELAYSKVQVECDICRACTIQEKRCCVRWHAAACFNMYIVFQIPAISIDFSCLCMPLHIQCIFPSSVHGQEAGCEVHAVAKDPFDCNAALNNFFRALWCQKDPKGSEGIQKSVGQSDLHAFFNIHTITYTITHYTLYFRTTAWNYAC